MELDHIVSRISNILSALRGGIAETAEAEEHFVFGDAQAFDSVWALRLIVELEKEFTIEVEDWDVVPENFCNLSALAGFVAAKLDQANPANGG